MTPEREAALRTLFHGGNGKPGLIKCRLIHMDGLSVVQPDLLLVDGIQRLFYVPKFFDPNIIGYSDDQASDVCRLTFVIEPSHLVTLAFFRGEVFKNCTDGSVIYKCRFIVEKSATRVLPSGRWRMSGDAVLLRLYHHTNQVGAEGIRQSSEVWGSQRNIQGNRWLSNIAYGYFTTVERIKTEQDLLDIAMSPSGLTGLIPTDAPYDVRYATMVAIPVQEAIGRAHTVTFWVDCELCAPYHCWMHRPIAKPAYYEVVLPKVFRVGVRPGANLKISGNEIVVEPADRKVFDYVIVGMADEESGLLAPYIEEETQSIAGLEKIELGDDIIAVWQRLANSDQLRGRAIEFAILQR